MIEREIPGTPHPAESGLSYVPPVKQPDPPGKPYLRYPIDGRTLVERFTFDAMPNASDGFAFDPEELNAIATEWDRLGDAFVLKQQRTGFLIKVQGPGAEYASAIHAEAVKNTGNGMIAAFCNREQYCRNQADNFRVVAQQYAGTDDRISKSLPEPETPPPGSFF